jgi:hypothetical protein
VEVGAGMVAILAELLACHKILEQKLRLQKVPYAAPAEGYPPRAVQENEVDAVLTTNVVPSGAADQRRVVAPEKQGDDRKRVKHRQYRTQ